MNMFPLQEKIIVITGPTRGFGRYLCQKLWLKGANIFGVSRSKDDLDELASSLLASSVVDKQMIKTYACDLSIEDAAVSITDNFLEHFQSLDSLILNAAIQGPIGNAWETNPGDWLKTLHVNLFSQVTIANSFMPLLLKNERSSIIFLSGGGATGPRPRFSAYAAAKAGLVRFAETLAFELMDTGVTVNAIAPGAMPTDMLRQVVASGQVLAGSKEIESAKKILNGGDLAMERTSDLVEFLISEESLGITGKLISAQWDDWENWPEYIDQLKQSELYTLRRVTCRDRGHTWGDK
jgi:3-oxoacyl-[acyl-carrier protein] reductase